MLTVVVKLKVVANGATTGLVAEVLFAIELNTTLLIIDPDPPAFCTAQYPAGKT